MAQPNSLEEQKQLVLDVIHVFDGTLEGQRLWKHLEKICFTRKTTLSDDPLKMAFNEGIRSVYLHLQTLKSIDPEQQEKRQKELDNDHG